MNRQDATQEIKARWREFYTPDGGGRGKGIICPICGSGSGKNGTGITEKPNSRNHFLKCWNGGCEFEQGGSVIDLYMLEHHMDTDDKRDFVKAVDEMAGTLGITIDPYTGPRSTAAEDFSDTSSHRKPAAAPQTGGNSFFSGTGTPEPQAVTGPAQAVTQPRPDYTSYYEQCMARIVESAGQDYLTGRGISLDTICYSIADADNCCIGFDPAWVSPTAIKRLRARGSTWTPPATPRVIIPVTESYYIARDIRPDDQIPDDEKKYKKMNEGEPVVFNVPALYGGAENVFVCEGAIDAFSFIEVGQAAIALNSTSNIDKLLKQLEAQPTAATLILCLDNDTAGKNATDTLKEGLDRLNISWIKADVTGGHKDPNEALTVDRAAFEQAIARTIAGTAAKPDNTLLYIDTMMAGEIEHFKQARDLKTGFANLDEKMGGLYSGLYVLAAISSLGKTTMALQMADNIAAAGHDVLFFSMEMSRLEMVSKSFARMTAQADMTKAVTSIAIRNGYLPAQVLQAKNRYRAQIGDRMSIIEGNFNCDVGFIGDYIRRYQQRTGTTPVCFVDYLQILQPAADGKSRGSKKDDVDMAITELKRLSRELDTPIIVISSLNRANYLTPFAFEALKESGQIEYTADCVMGLQLSCLDESTFSKDGSITEKRKRVDAAKVENPRKLKFVCLKNRYGISNYDCYFDYYPANDLFLPAQAPAGTTPKAGRRL